MAWGRRRGWKSGMNGAHRTRWRPLPRIKPEAEFWDSFLDFGGGIIFPRGRAFATADEPPRPAGTPAKVELANPRAPGYIPVGKQWFRMTNSNTSVLVEGVLWQDIEPLLSSLPEMAQGSSAPTGEDRVLCLNEALGARRPPPSASAEDKILLAGSAYAPKGVVLDWDQVTGGTSYEFGYSSGPPHTYEIAQTVWFSGGTLKFWPNAVLKYVPNTSMHFDGNESIVCNGDISNRTVLTSRDDDLYGEVLPDSSHVPSQNGYIIPLWGQPAPSGTVFLGLTFRWIYIGIVVDDISPGSCTVKRCDFNFCGSAINMVHYAQATIQGSTCCHVDLPIDPAGGGTVTGSFDDICANNVDSDGNGLPDYWEYQWFGHTGVDLNADSDGDCTLNGAEYSAGSNPADYLYVTSCYGTYDHVIHAGAGTALEVTANLPCAKYQWYSGSTAIPGATSSSFTPTSTYDNSDIHANVYSASYSTNTPDVLLAVLDDLRWGMWTNWIAPGYTNNMTTQIMISTNYYPPEWLWANPSLIYNKAGFTGLSMCHDRQGATGQTPITALTDRIGYCRGHGVAGPEDFTCLASMTTGLARTSGSATGITISSRM